MRVLLAFDKLKDSLTAAEACAAAAEAIREALPKAQIDLCPLTDGGEGFASILARSAGGELRPIQVSGPRGRAVSAAYAAVAHDNIPGAIHATLGLRGGPDRLAVVEMASASGLSLLSQTERDPWQTTTQGTGELIAAAAKGASAIVLGVGGSATNDLGLGALDALGLHCRSGHGTRIAPPTPVAWAQVDRFDGKPAALPPIFIACDVTNPLLGRNGAAAIYGPQKGLRAADVARLDHEAARMALMLCAHFGQPDAAMDVPGAGAAGGIAFGLMVAAGARLLPGAEFVASWLDLDARIAAADLVLTGEGRFDDSSLQGKGPGDVVARAVKQQKAVHVFAGEVATSQRPAGVAVHQITPAQTALHEALRQGRENLTRAVRAALGSVERRDW